jgi:nitrite reductase/ring-hydroxylating ferredoxin subunit
MEYAVCASDALAPGELRSFMVGGRDIVVARTGDGAYHALRNVCSHQGAPLHAGRLIDEVRSDRVGSFEVGASSAVLRCPWHGYEFSATTGRCLADAEHQRVRAYTVTVRDDTVMVDV